MFVERLNRLPAILGAFRPGPPASDRDAWEALPAAVKLALVRAGEAALTAPYPALPATLYLGYTRSGDRLGFETPYFARRRLLDALVLAECVQRSGRFMDRIVEGVLLLSEESGWQLPAHNARQRGGPRLPLPDPDDPVIDLFAAETGALLAVLAALLGDALETAAPGLVARIDRELERRIVVPYLTRHFWWMGNGDEPMNNWTAWCTQNVLLTLFCRPWDAARRRQVVERAAAGLDAFLKDYGEDGACEEGVLYYRHAGLCLFNALQVLDAAAPGCFAPLWHEPKLRDIAEYILHVHVDGQRYFNFGDCPALAERCGAREFLFGRAVGSAALADFAAADWQQERRTDLGDEINLFYRVQAAFAAAGLAAWKPGPVRPADTFLSSIGLFVARDEHFALAVKAGDNGDSHNHNDVGSVILHKDGRPVLIDVGVESYTAKTFSARRYDIWTMQSAWHNLPSFDGVMQRDGAGFAAREAEPTFGPDAAGISMEIAGAYPAAAGVRSYRRRVTLDKGRNVEIVDRCEGDRPATLSLMLETEPRLEAGRIVLPGLAEISVEGAGALTVEAVPIADPRLRGSWPEQLYRVLVPLAGGTLRLRIV
jgi:hypothetical protein